MRNGVEFDRNLLAIDCERAAIGSVQRKPQIETGAEIEAFQRACGIFRLATAEHDGNWRSGLDVC